MLVLLALLPIAAPAATNASPAPDRTPPPQIIRVITTPFCAKLHERIRPAVALILQNDQTIAKSQPLFKKYAQGAFAAQDPAAGNFSNGAPPANDSIYNQSPATGLALQQMSYLVSPIAQNLIATQRLLDDVELQKTTGNPQDDKALQQLRQQLLATVAFQSASLDLINGWVTTQQMGDLQHAGTEYIGQIGGTELQKPILHETPSPWQDPNTPGIAPNPYAIDLAAIPGLTVGYNPLSRVMEAQQWLTHETTKREDAAASGITAALQECAK